MPTKKEEKQEHVLQNGFPGANDFFLNKVARRLRFRFGENPSDRHALGIHLLREFLTSSTATQENEMRLQALTP